MTENSLMFPPQALCTNSSSTEIIPADCYFIWNTIFSDKFPWPFLETRLPSPPLLSDQFSSVQFSYSVMSNSLRPHGLQHARPPCPSPTPGAYPNSCPFSWRCRQTISSAVVSFSFCLQSFPAWGSFPVSQFFAWGGQSVGVSASTSVLPMNTQVWYPLGWTGWISLQSKGLSRLFSNTTVQKHQFLGTQLSL